MVKAEEEQSMSLNLELLNKSSDSIQKDTTFMI
jgi:hypothetical protein